MDGTGRAVRPHHGAIGPARRLRCVPARDECRSSAQTQFTTITVIGGTTTHIAQSVFIGFLELSDVHLGDQILTAHGADVFFGDLVLGRHEEYEALAQCGCQFFHLNAPHALRSMSSDT